jgi:hypothetical protein
VKFRLNTKYFRPRVSIWVGLAGAATFSFLAYTFITGAQKHPASINQWSLIALALLFIIGFVGFSYVALAGIKTYREQYMAYDKARLKRKGILPKLSVIGDWLTN